MTATTRAIQLLILVLAESLFAQNPSIATQVNESKTSGQPGSAIRLSMGQPGSGRLTRDSFNSQPSAKSDAEKKALDVLDDMNKNQRRGSLSVPMDDGRILRLLVESMNAQNVVEIGTSIGYSGTWFCLALKATGGHLTTFEIDPERVAIARKNFDKAGVSPQVTIVEGDAHKEVAKLKDKGNIDLLFLDADKEGYLDYLNQLLPLLRPGGLIVAHNINPRQADPAYLKAITTNSALETIFLNLETSGISVTMKKR